jgi:hypothetical protein
MMGEGWRRESGGENDLRVGQVGGRGASGRTCDMSRFVRLDPNIEQIRDTNRSSMDSLSIWVAPLGAVLPIFLSVRTRSDRGWSFGFAR